VNAPSIKSVCICACTYRRPDGLREMLRGLERQTFANLPPAFQVVIADNEGSDLAREVCEQVERRSGLPVTYIHEPTRGISFARNACLDHIPAECEFFAFIDDDEVPEPGWLEGLLEAQQATGAEVVQGPVVPMFCAGAPEWLVTGDFLGWPRRGWRGVRQHLEKFQELTEAYTGNVLVRTSSVKQIELRFDPAFALTGGGDTAFFRRLHAAGNRIVFAPAAVVVETVPPERANLWYRLRVEYRVGINPLSAKKKKKNTKKIFRRIKYMWRDSGPQKITFGLWYLAISCLSGKPTMDKTVVALLRMAFGAGQCARFLGLKYYIYR
jgi:succinoglycan biosynthesis protein ExoM